MENRNTKARRTGWEFDRREKAYHSYMFTLQRRNYGTSIRSYARDHNLSRDALRSWIDRYPGGRPFYDADDMTQQAPEPPRGEAQMVKLNAQQLEKPLPAHDMITQSDSGNVIRIEYYGASIQASGKDVVTVLAAIRSLSGLLR